MNIPRIGQNCYVLKKFLHLQTPYKPNSRYVKSLPFRKTVEIWWKSLSSNRLQVLQDRLVELLYSSQLKENCGVKRGSDKTSIDLEGNYINSITFEVINDPSFVTKHVVFVHGYGASLGCYARNFHIVNSLKGLKNNYKVHFLDNISFGLSSNPKIPSINYWKPIPKMNHITLNDDDVPTLRKNLHKKYYKLIKLFDVDVNRLDNIKQELKPIFSDMESYYVDALENWRINCGISKIDFLIGHSFGGYWSASYALRYSESLDNLILLSPVGMERTAYSVTAPKPSKTKEIEPNVGPNSFEFLSRFPLLSRLTIFKWYYLQPYLPRLLKLMGPFGVTKYYDMWYSKLFAVNKVIAKLGGKVAITSSNELRYGTNTECQLLVEYLYNSITNGTRSDIHIKYLLTPATTSRWPLFDKFMSTPKETLEKFNMHIVYGKHDFMYSDAGLELVDKLKDLPLKNVNYHEVVEGGHNLYLQNPFGTNKLLKKLITLKD